MKRCLVVDDSRIVRTIARRILEDLDFNVEEAADGQEALAACRGTIPDVILLDWNMPVMNGLEFLERFRRMKGGESPQVIFCSTENDTEHIAHAIRAGANEYIMKPFDSEIIRSKLAQVGLIA